MDHSLISLLCSLRLVCLLSLSLSLSRFFSTSSRNVCFIVQLSIFQFTVVPIVSFLKLFSCLRLFCKVIDQLKLFSWVLL